MLSAALARLPVVAAPRLPVSTSPSSVSTTTMYVERLDVSVERVEVQRRQTADGRAVTGEY